MSGSNSEIGRVLGATPVIAGGAALLPNTGDNLLTAVLATIMIIAGGAVVISTLLSKFLAKR